MKINMFASKTMGTSTFVKKCMTGLLLILCCQNVFAHGHESKVFEMRTYTAHEGKLEALNARFRDHTFALFKKHGISNIGYWIPTDKPNTLVYMIAHKNKASAAASWKAFISDPDWIKARADSIVDGKLVANIESVYMDPTDYSPAH